MSGIIEINIVNSIAVFFASVIPIYLSYHLKGNLRNLTILLSLFAVVHAIYHTIEVFGYEELAENVVEPLSVIVLVFFGLWYLRIRSFRRVSV